jgi:hypothetical protein
VEYLDVMYQKALPVRSRSVNVLAIMKFRVTFGSGRVNHDSPRT